jgi:hypothetical protein
MVSMATDTFSPATEAAIWTRVIHPNGELTPEAARVIVQLSFPARDRERMHELSAKARAGTLTLEEEVEMDGYERVGALLSILQSKARQVLKKGRRKPSA